MKKLILLILVLYMIFVTSCGNSTQTETTTAEPNVTNGSATTVSSTIESTSSRDSRLTPDIDISISF